MNIVPMHDKVVVKRNEAEQTSTGGIILAPSSKEQSFQGTVVSVGPGKVLANGTVVPMTVAVGNTVAFATYAGSQTLKVGEEEFIVMSESEILAILE